MKPGDEVIVQSRNGKEIRKIMRMTKTQIVIRNYYKFWIKNGWEVGGYDNIHIPDEGEKEKIISERREQQRRNKIWSELRELKLYDLPTDKMERIIQIIKE